MQIAEISIRADACAEQSAEQRIAAPVKAFLLDGVFGALVWDAEGARELRARHRMVGGLVGAHPLQPRQSSQQLGLPLHLMPEEISLLREEGALELRMYVSPEPSPDEEARFSHLRQRDGQRQLEAYQEKKHQEHTHPSTSKAPSFSPLSHILTADPRLRSDPAHFPKAHWTYPHTPSEERRCAVFRDLRARGYMLTSGVKYGGAYLVYTADPALVHSCYIALVLPWQQPIKSLPSLCRVGSKVVKAVLLCSVVEGGGVRYQTVQWNPS